MPDATPHRAAMHDDDGRRGPVRSLTAVGQPADERERGVAISPTFDYPSVSGAVPR